MADKDRNFIIKYTKNSDSIDGTTKLGNLLKRFIVQLNELYEGELTFDIRLKDKNK